MMDLDDLRIFKAVVQAGGITPAAHRLHRVQSNVTTRIRQLEASLGVSLFFREGRRLQLAPAGRVLLDYAERLLDLAEEAQVAVGGGEPLGRLRLGSMESTASTRLPPMLARFHQVYPLVNLELRTGPTARLTAEVLEGQLDCALVSTPVSDERLALFPVFAEELMLVTPLDHPPVTRPRDLQLRTLLTFAAGCAYRLKLESWLATDALMAERVVELASYHTMLGCAAAGMGIALVPASLLAKLPEAAHVSCHALPPEIARVSTLLIHRKRGAGSAVSAFLAILQASSAG